MILLSRRDVRSALVTGLTTGVIGWRIFLFLDIGLPWNIPISALVVALPVLWVLGVQFGYVLGALWRPMTMFGRFVAIGFANASIDFGVLYLLIGLTSQAEGVAFSAFKMISFCVAVVHSYLWNKHWVFDSGGSGGGRREFQRFVAVALASAVVNVGVASLVVASRPEAFTPAVWAGIAAATGSAVALIFSFAGFRTFVFVKKLV